MALFTVHSLCTVSPQLLPMQMGEKGQKFREETREERSGQKNETIWALNCNRRTETWWRITRRQDKSRGRGSNVKEKRWSEKWEQAQLNISVRTREVTASVSHFMDGSEMGSAAKTGAPTYMPTFLCSYLSCSNHCCFLKNARTLPHCC